jgi:hypothetical protein
MNKASTAAEHTNCFYEVILRLHKFFINTINFLPKNSCTASANPSVTTALYGTGHPSVTVQHWIQSPEVGSQGRGEQPPLARPSVQK